MSLRGWETMKALGLGTYVLAADVVSWGRTEDWMGKQERRHR